MIRESDVIESDVIESDVIESDVIESTCSRYSIDILEILEMNHKRK